MRSKGLSDKVSNFAKTFLDKEYIESRRFFVYESVGGRYQVMIPDGESHIVHLEKKTCTCGVFQDRLLPCRHVISACRHRTDDPYTYVDGYYSRLTYVYTYQMGMLPIRKEDFDLDVLDAAEGVCGPPILAKQRGRPKKRRFRRKEEDGRDTRKKCTHCGERGHNRRSCKNAAAV